VTSPTVCALCSLWSTRFWLTNSFVVLGSTSRKIIGYINPLTLILLTCRIWWASNNASRWQMGFNSVFKGLDAELNPICNLLALLRAHHIFHVSRVRVKRVILIIEMQCFFLSDGSRVWKKCLGKFQASIVYE